MSKKNQIDFDKTVEMKCEVCEKCYRYANLPYNQCVFGGPFKGYFLVS